MRYHYTPIRMSNITKINHTMCLQECGVIATSYTASGNVKQYNLAIIF